MVGQGFLRVQALCKEIYRLKLVCVNVISLQEACGIYPGLDQLFWNIGVLSTDTRDRSLAATAHPYMLLEQWRYCRTKVRRLLSLGTNLKLAIDVGLSRKGPWRLSRTLAIHSGMTNEWLKGHGLVSVKELWVKIHYPATAR